ncbi:vanin-like protein 1 [Onthophagus taurus]|uniref:vanin-like protein 1 n=1 Tax=Onthophagus taurus TaxID=166361 RepID=UPI0039BE333D
MASGTNFGVLFLIGFLIKSGIAQTSYNAAVIEYAKSSDSSVSDLDNMMLRLRDYESLISNLKSSNIIVFPEYGLTTPYLPENLEPLSTFVPDPAENISPCSTKDSYEKVLIDLSCTAQTHGVFVVVNLIEKSISSSNTTIFYNTNVVFNGSGTVVARYRKINLCKEPKFTKGENVATFTAFGVNFGLMTSCDLLYEHPARTMLANTNVTDIIYPHAWVAETPFLHSLSIQDGFAKANGINLLSATYRNSSDGMGGFGIFSAKSATTSLDISTGISYKSSTGNLEKLTNKMPEAVCNNNIEITPRIGGVPPSIDKFNNTIENLNLYTTKDLVVTDNIAKVQICSEGSLFCCDFYVEFQDGYASSNSPVYKVAAFYGTKQVNITGKNLGFRTCALLVCANNDLQSCGETPPDSSPIKQISLQANLPKGDRTLYMPSTLKKDLHPLTGYAFCQNVEGDVIGTTMSANNVEKLWTFGIVGRVYDLDDRPEGRGTASYFRSGFGLILMLIATQFFFQ